MASISEEFNGHKTVQFVGDDGKRRSIRLGKANMHQAQDAKRFVEDLVACKHTGGTAKSATLEWIAGLPDVMHKRLENVNLIGPSIRRECPTLGQWLGEYVDGRSDVKPATATVYGHTKRNLLAFFGEGKRIDEIAPGDADNFRISLKMTEDLADNTVRRRMGIAKQFFRAAMRKRLLTENPFDGQSSLVRENPKRLYFVSLQEAQAVIDALQDAKWRLLFALARYGGLRTPTEVARLKWEDVNWEKMRFTVHAAKTEHHANAGIRVVPIFTELYPYFRDAFEAAQPGDVYCCPQYTNAAQMYRKAVDKAIAQAGLKPWPKMFQNLRSTRETELAEKYPVQVVCAWIGNTPAIAARHYLQVTEAHFEKAVQNPVQHDAEQDVMERQEDLGQSPEPAICGPVLAGATSCSEHMDVSSGQYRT